MHSNILFIDDDSAVLDALEWTFADEPYECLTCKTADEARSLINEMDFAVVVSDQRMPEMSGIDFLERLNVITSYSIHYTKLYDPSLFHYLLW